MMISRHIRRSQTPLKQTNFLKIHRRMMMLLHEYQAQNLLKSYEVPIPRGSVVKNTEDIDFALKELGKTTGYAVKSQVHTGGRGLGHFKENNFKGGVQIASTADEVRDVVPKMIGNTLITKQTGEKGMKCNSLYIVEKVGKEFVKQLDVVNEKYFSITLDRKYQGPVMIASSEGGVNIEEISKTNPSAIKMLPIDILKGLDEQAALDYVKSLNYTGELAEQAKDIVMKLYKTFIEKDALMIEINPLATVTENGKERVMVIDSKISIDENAKYRQPELAEIIDITNKNPTELEADKYNLNYIRLDGNIGCLVNGAGLAMATMDIIKLHGGEPANFLDVGGGADEEGMTEALRLLNNDKDVDAILINIFGGILRCDLLVSAIIGATEKYNLTKNIVLRLKGTNSKEAREVINKSNVKNIIFTQDLDEAAKKSVEIAKNSK